MLLDIGQIDGVTVHQKLDCRRNDQERRNVDREYQKGLHGNFLRDARSGYYHNPSRCGGLSTAQMPTGFYEGPKMPFLLSAQDFQTGLPDRTSRQDFQTGLPDEISCPLQRVDEEAAN
jgi:hypothetical protein